MTDDPNDRKGPPAGGFGNPYEPPHPQGEQPPASYQPPGEPALGYAWNPERRNRGGCLTALLVLMMIANPLVGILYVVGQDFVRKGLPHAPDWAFPVLAVAGFANFACAIGMWKWKRWGVIGSVSIAAITLVVNFAIGIPPMSALMGLGGPIILIFLIRPLWRGFD